MLLTRISLATAILLTFGASTAGAQINTNTDSSTSPLLAQRPVESGRQRLDELNLDSRQRDELRKIQERYREEISEKADDLRAAQDRLTLMFSGNNSERDIRRQYQEVERLRQSLSELRFNNKLEIHRILDREQRRRFAEIMEDRRDNFRHNTNNRDSFDFFR